MLTSPVTESENGKDSLERIDLATLEIPVEVISHVEDHCPASPHEGAKALARERAWSFVVEKGGSEHCTDDKCRCGPASHHGFQDLDASVVPKILAFIDAG